MLNIRVILGLIVALFVLLSPWRNSQAAETQTDCFKSANAVNAAQQRALQKEFEHNRKPPLSEFCKTRKAEIDKLFRDSEAECRKTNLPDKPKMYLDCTRKKHNMLRENELALWMMQCPNVEDDGTNAQKLKREALKAEHLRNLLACLLLPKR